jgi:hypothetical protein
MAAAIKAAEPAALKESDTPPELYTAFAVDLADYCATDPCAKGLHGPGWAVVFNVTNVEREPSLEPYLFFVLLDRQNHVRGVQ